MNSQIPTYQLHMFADYDEAAAEVFCPEHCAGGKAVAPISVPYRSDYYKISLCLSGTAELKVNLQTSVVSPGCLVLVTPYIIKQWTHISDDYETLSVFFTSDFITKNNAHVGKLGFLLNPTAYVLPLSAPEATNIAASFRFLQQKYRTPHANRRDIVKNIINGLLYEIGALYDQEPAPFPVAHPRSQELTTEFKQLIQTYSASARSVTFYADKLCVTPKHLTEIVREVTGKTASDLIAEAVVLEAKALLQTTKLPMQQIADKLHFADQFAFSRFFKKSTGLSPTAYKQV
ncbi:helix-turn-helix transcriptional regulator [Hymenobacter sp. YC55]|uniref:AraC family transcriptional regulator n=1 Tax=Hymenobacter sp. YC55 TaxID=3034019 RepID=UPI0023F94E47|nr:helix-turn-helix transcriptional regulator [Hymenobacter sp. YC55]MDF7815621.1 helix-turn-helix transcriptional regulator [Hymenobacter sp. YC55]